MKTESLAKTALMTALVFVLTRFTQVPIPGTANHIVHLGQPLVMLLIFILPLKHAMFAASLGSALADILSPGIYWTPATLIIKAVMVYIVYKFRNVKIIGFLLSGVFMAVSYYLYEVMIFTQNFIASMPNLVVLLLEVAGSVVVALALCPLILRSMGGNVGELQSDKE